MSLLTNKSVTLLELLLAITLLGLMVLGISNLEVFSRYQLISSDRRAKLQHDASYVLERMAQEINKAIGNRAISSQDPIDSSPIAGDYAIKVYVDLASDGESPGDGQRGTTGGDRWRAYRFTDATGNPNNRYQIWYYSNYVNPGSSYEIISRNVSAFTASASPASNYVDVEITTCWDPDGIPVACGFSSDNPQVEMKNGIKMPSVSTN